MTSQPPRLLDQVRRRIRLKGYSIRTERAYVSWIKRFIKNESVWLFSESRSLTLSLFLFLMGLTGVTG
jgi:hypothetical protein